MKKARFLLVGASALTLWGCGGGNGPVANSNALVNGRAALTQLATNTSSASTQSLQSALSLFLQALQQNPNSSEAHFGAAVCLMGAAAQEVDGIGGTATVPPTVTPALASKRIASQSLVSKPTRDAGASPGNPGTGVGSPGFVLPAPPTQGVVPPTPPNGTVIPRPIEPVHTLGLFWFLDRGLSNPSTLLNMLSPISDLHLGLISYYGYAGDIQEVARRQKLLTDLETVAQHLQTVEADPTFTITLPAPDQNGKTVTIGLPEVYLFDAYVQSLRVSTALSLTYNRDPGGSGLLPPTHGGSGGSTGSAPDPPTPPIFVNKGRDVVVDPGPNSPFLTLDKNSDGKLTPEEYLPASPFLTLRDASYFHTAQAAMLSIVDRETKGIAGVLARPSTDSFLVPNSPDVAVALTSIRDNILPLIQQATSGPITLKIPHYETIPLSAVHGGTVQPMTAPNALFVSAPVATTTHIPAQGTFFEIPTEAVTIDLAAWFVHPPADLKKLAPTYVLNSIGYPNYSLTTYPDPTFGGLFPNGLPADFNL